MGGGTDTILTSYRATIQYLNMSEKNCRFLLEYEKNTNDTKMNYLATNHEVSES